MILTFSLMIIFDNSYICKNDNRTSNCDYLDKHYGLENGECVIEDLPNKRCPTGWEKDYGG